MRKKDCDISIWQYYTGRDGFICIMLILLLTNLFISISVWAQDRNTIAGAILKLPRKILPPQQIVDGQLYSGKILAVITDHDGKIENFEGNDEINFSIQSLRGNGRLDFKGTRSEFDRFIELYANNLLQLLFPTSMSESVTGQDAVINHAQQFLISKVLERKAKRSQLGGLIEYEWFKVDGISGKAWESLAYVDRFSLAVEGRYAILNDALNTKSMTGGLDFYPHFAIRTGSLEGMWGIDAYSIFLFSQSDAFDLGSFDVGGGMWTSIRKDFSRFRFGAGAVLQGSKTYIPLSWVPAGIEFLATSINKRKPDFNLTYGAILGILLSERLSFNAKVVETNSFTQTAGYSLTGKTVVLTSLSYLFADHIPIDLGYKIASDFDGASSNAVFLQGNFRW